MSLFFNVPVQNTDEHLLAAKAACTLYTSWVSVSRNAGISDIIAVSLTAWKCKIRRFSLKNAMQNWKKGKKSVEKVAYFWLATQTMDETRGILKFLEELRYTVRFAAQVQFDGCHTVLEEQFEIGMSILFRAKLMKFGSIRVVSWFYTGNNSIP